MPIRSFCCPVDVMSRTVFFINLNSTFGSLRKELSRKGVYFATSHNLGNADTVYDTSQCRRYLSIAQCLFCFDVGVSILTSCETTRNGAYVIVDDCFISWSIWWMDLYGRTRLSGNRRWFVSLSLFQILIRREHLNIPTTNGRKHGKLRVK